MSFCFYIGGYILTGGGYNLWVRARLMFVFSIINGARGLYFGHRARIYYVIFRGGTQLSNEHFMDRSRAHAALRLKSVRLIAVNPGTSVYLT